MTIPEQKIYPRTGDTQTVYLKNVITNPNILVGEYSIYNDFENDPTRFECQNVLYHYPINHDRLVIGKFCSIACGAKFLFNSANHTLRSLSTYPFPLFFEEWGLQKECVADSWDNKGDIVIGNDVWIGYQAYTIVCGVPAKPIRRRFPETTVQKLLQLQWWDWPEERIAENIAAIQSGSIEQIV